MCILISRRGLWFLCCQYNLYIFMFLLAANGYRIITGSESRPQKLHNLQIEGMLTYSLWYAYFFSVSPWSSQGPMISTSWIHLWNTTRYSTKSHTWAIHVHFSDAELMTSLVDRRQWHLPSWCRRRVWDDWDSSDNSLPVVTNHQ